jgi:20S proteasome alpha/beta subunit
MISRLLPKPPQKLYIRPVRKEANAMTIALGFNCFDGVLLCADTQMTGRAAGVKFNEEKIHSISRLGTENDFAVALTYAGDPSIMKSMIEIMRRALDRPLETVTVESVRETLQRALIEVHANSPNIDEEYIDVICAVSIVNPKTDSITYCRSDTAMFVGRRTTLHREYGTAFAGIGDNSLARFLASTLPLNRDNLTVNEALLIGAYIVEQAKAFADGCGGETQSLVVCDGKTSMIYDTDRHIFSSGQCVVLAKTIHKCIEKVFSSLLDADSDVEDLQPDLRKTKTEINQFYGVSPT